MDISQPQPLSWRSSSIPLDYAVLGDPIDHSLSPQIHMAAYRAAGLPFRYGAMRVLAGELPEALDHLAQLGLRGVNITVPLKEEAFAWCQEFEGLNAGAANTANLATRTGTNTDAPALVATLAEQGIEPGSRILILGAGGAARSALLACERSGFHVAAWNRTRARLQHLVEELRISVSIQDEPDMADAAVVINATSASLVGENLAICWDRFSPNCLAYDLAYASGPTIFLQKAADAGLRTLDGKRMLVEQAALAFEWWLGISAPRTAMLKAIHL